jgi:hypothetical protein
LSTVNPLPRGTGRSGVQVVALLLLVGFCAGCGARLYAIAVVHSPATRRVWVQVEERSTRPTFSASKTGVRTSRSVVGLRTTLAVDLARGAVEQQPNVTCLPLRGRSCVPFKITRGIISELLTPRGWVSAPRSFQTSPLGTAPTAVAPGLYASQKRVTSASALELWDWRAGTTWRVDLAAGLGAGRVEYVALENGLLGVVHRASGSPRATTVRVIDLRRRASPRSGWRLETTHDFSVRFSPDGRHFAALLDGPSGTKRIQIIDVVTLKPVGEQVTKNRVDWLAFSSPRRLLWSSSGVTYLYDLPSAKLTRAGTNCEEFASHVPFGRAFRCADRRGWRLDLGRGELLRLSSYVKRFGLLWLGEQAFHVVSNSRGHRIQRVAGGPLRRWPAPVRLGRVVGVDARMGVLIFTATAAGTLAVVTFRPRDRHWSIVPLRLHGRAIRASR